jgi:hypothetical protein
MTGEPFLSPRAWPPVATTYRPLRGLGKGGADFSFPRISLRFIRDYVISAPAGPFRLIRFLRPDGLTRHAHASSFAILLRQGFEETSYGGQERGHGTSLGCAAAVNKAVG